MTYTMLTLFQLSSLVDKEMVWDSYGLQDQVISRATKCQLHSAANQLNASTRLILFELLQ